MFGVYLLIYNWVSSRQAFLNLLIRFYMNLIEISIPIEISCIYICGIGQGDVMPQAFSENLTGKG